MIAIHKGRYYKKGDGIALGPGPFVTALEYSCDTKSEVVGKPEPGFFKQVLDNMNADAESTVMIGDVCPKCVFILYPILVKTHGHLLCVVYFELSIIILL